MDALSDVEILNRVPWTLFVTLTFRGEKSQSIRARMLFAWLRITARHFGVHFHRLLWVARSERGESFGRAHFHLLIGGFRSDVTKNDIFRLMARWERDCGGGMSRIVRYDARLSAGAYLLKPEKIGGQVYEERKFDTRNADLTIAHAVRQKWMRRRDLHAIRGV